MSEDLSSQKSRAAIFDFLRSSERDTILTEASKPIQSQPKQSQPCPTPPAAFTQTQLEAMSDEDGYTDFQVGSFYSRIALPKEHRHLSKQISSKSADEQLAHLALVQKYALCSIPFENLNLHYSAHKTISLHLDDLYYKMVGNVNAGNGNGKGRGGYCMENNWLFGNMLRALGYKVRSVGARVANGGPNYGGWSHMVNVVNIANTFYMVDIGYGPDGPTLPLHLKDSTKAIPHIEPSAQRIVRKSINPSTNFDPTQRLWVYQHRINDDEKWRDMYCFTDLEFFPRDYEIMNIYTSTSRKTWFTQLIVCTKLIMDEEGNLIGQAILGENFKRRIKGEKKDAREFKTEEDRVRCLEEEFGIRLSGAEREGIKRTVSAIT